MPAWSALRPLPLRVPGRTAAHEIPAREAIEPTGRGAAVAAQRAEGICAACAGADVRTFSYADLPDVVAEEGWVGHGRMGAAKDVPPPIPILTLFRFDEEAVAHDAKRMGAACPAGNGSPWKVAAGGSARARTT